MTAVDHALDHICGRRPIGDYYVSVERTLGSGCRQGTIWVSECPGGAYQSIGNFKISDDLSLVLNLKSFHGSICLFQCLLWASLKASIYLGTSDPKNPSILSKNLSSYIFVINGIFFFATYL